MLIGMSMTREGLCSIQCMNYVEKHLMYFHILVPVIRKKFFWYQRISNNFHIFMLQVINLATRKQQCCVYCLAIAN